MSKTMIVIGAGLAGLSAALAAAAKGHRVKLVSPMPSERAQSVMAEGGINAALDTKGENDNPAEHFRDTVTAGAGLSDPGAVRELTEAAPAIVRRLLALGVQFNMDARNEPDLRNFGGQRKKRTAFARCDTGKQIMTALIDAVRRYEAAGLVERYSRHSFITLATDGPTCRGALIRDERTTQNIPLAGDAVIIAAGGMHGLFGNTTGSVGNTGEVTAELFRLGIPVANGEFIQYHPTTVNCPGRQMLISEAARGEGGRLFAMRDGKRWYFMEDKYPEAGNLMPRDIVSREVWEQNKYSRVYLDLTALPADVLRQKLSGTVDDCLTCLRLDPRREPIPVTPGIHYFMGGILVDRRHRTALKNLYAAGECCCQYHGANRLGGNSLLGAIHGGTVAAETAMEEAASDQPANDIPLTAPVHETPPHVLDELQRIMRSSLGVERDGTGLAAGLAEVKELPGNLPLLGRALLMSALAREESRGAHIRTDFPVRNDPEYCKLTVARFHGTEIEVCFESVPETREAL